MGNSVLNVAVTGLNAAQLGIQTSGHNVANASTPGFSRQQIVQSSNTPMFTGAGYIGQGTHVSTIQRVYNQHINAQVLTAQTSLAEYDAYRAQISQIDNLLADPHAGLSPALANLFQGVQEVAASPTSLPSRQALLSSAQALAVRLQSLNQRLAEVREGVNSQLASEVAAINSQASQIANINQQIMLAEAAGPGQPVNDLLDQRERLLADLNREIRITTATQSDGTYSVFIGNGQPLVVGAQTATLQATAAVDDVQKIVIALKTSSGLSSTVQESLLAGGSLGGLLAFRSQSLDPAQNALGRVAIGLAKSFNDQHRLGQDLAGALGGDFFTVPQPTVFPAATNSGGATLTATLDEVADLTDSDYRISYSAADGGSYTLTRLADNASWSAASLAGLPPAAAPQGYALSISGTPADGDSFLIEPTRNGARDIAVAVTDLRAIAAASPIRTAAALGNSGSGAIDAGTAVGPPPAAALRNSVSITFTSPTRFDVVDTTAGTTLAANVAYDADDGATVSYNGWTAALTGSPAAGDRFSVDANSNGVADNRNALALGALQTVNTLSAPAGGTATANFQSSYAQLVARVGNKAREIAVLREAHVTLEAQAQRARDSVSGVNLDEEAANLMRYQQAYQAAAKMVGVADKLFNLLLEL